VETRSIHGEVASSNGEITRNVVLSTEAFAGGFITPEMETLRGGITVCFEGRSYDGLFYGLYIEGMRPHILLQLELREGMGYVAITLHRDGSWLLGERMAIVSPRLKTSASQLWAALGY
jgi:hypothetical protein